VEKSQDFDDYTKLVQEDASKFDGSTMKMMTLPGGALALVGQLAEGIDPKGMLTISEQVAKDNPLDTALDATVATVTEEIAPYSYDITFRDLFWREWDALHQVIYGTLSQAASDPKKRKGTILTAIDAFRSFMSMGLDNISTAAMKLEKEESETQEGENDMFKTKEEFVEAVGAVVDERLKVFKAEAEKAAPCDEKPKKKDEETTESKGELDISGMIASGIKEALAPLVQKVEAVVAKQDELEGQLSGETASKEEEPETEVASKEDDNAKKSVFGGLLTGKALTKGSLQSVLHGGV